MPVFANIPTYNNTVQASSVTYQNADVPSVTNVKQMLDLLENRLVFSSYAEFPTIGKDNTVYVDTSSDSMYLYDSKNKIYKPIVIDSTQNNFVIQSVL